MRQAGRYQPEYREIRKKHRLLDICRQPALTAEVTLLPVRQFGLDAAILFSDIMIPLGGMGVRFDIIEQVGPVVDEPIRTAADIARLRPLDPEAAVPFVLEAIRILRRELNVPLIGFSGAPFTLASYLVEGRPTRSYTRTKQLMYSQPALWNDLMERLSDMVVTYLRAQASAGAQALQVFDSWVGALAPRDYHVSVLPHMRSIFERLSDLGVPLIHFGVGTGALLELMRRAGGDVIGVDWRVPLGWAWERIGDDVSIQGNLDPTVLLAPREVIRERALEVLAEAAGRPGHIFNLGHGVLPETPVAAVQYLVEVVQESSARGNRAGAGKGQSAS